MSLSCRSCCARPKRVYSITLSARTNNLWNRHTHSLSGLEVDHQIEFCRLLDRDVDDFDAAQELNELSGVNVSIDVHYAGSIGSKSTFLCHV
jgi:hypothetical protein